MALSELSSAEAARPRWVDPIFYRGVIALAQGDLQTADQLIHRALIASPNDSRFLLGLVRLRLAEWQDPFSRDPKLLADAAHRLAGVASTPSELAAAAVALRLTSELPDALGLAERAVSILPVDPSLLDILANVLFDSGRVEEALETQEKAVAFAGEDSHRDHFERRLERYRAAAR